MNWKNTFSLRNKWTGALVLLVIWVSSLQSVMAITKNDADVCYKKGNYQQAIIDYQSLLRHGVSADIYYNLGNAYYRSDSLAQAILAYERASQLAPGDKDIAFNLQFARSKTIDKLIPESENVFVAWYHHIVSLTSANTWAVFGIAMIVIALILMLVYLFAFSLGLRKLGFFGGIVCFVLFLLSTLFAWTQRHEMLYHTGAIVITPSVGVKATPASSGTDQFILHEGTKVEVTDQSIGGWVGFRLSDGREGWVRDSAIEII